MDRGDSRVRISLALRNASGRQAAGAKRSPGLGSSIRAATLMVAAATGAIIIIVGLLGGQAQACERVTTTHGIVCACSKLDELKFQWPHDDSHLLRMVSNEAGARFQLDSIRPQPDQSEPHFRLRLDINRRHQQVAGYGGAITDSAAMLIQANLSAECHSNLMRDLFGPTGLDYNLARVPIGGTDMSSRSYSYDDLPAGQEDFQLGSFALSSEDFLYKLPLIREAIEMRANASGELDTGLAQQQQHTANDTSQLESPLRLLASSWSAPNWMKSNNKLVQGHLKESPTQLLDGKYYDAYARYIIKFLDEYERQLSTPQRQHKIWALTPQNEPCTPARLGHEVVNYNSVNFDPGQYARFVHSHLVPSLVRANRSSSQLALFTWDDTLLGLDRYMNQLFTDDYIRGLALHWYAQGLDKVPYAGLYELRRRVPSLNSIISTEASFIGRPKPGNWTRAERYARDIIVNLRAGSLGWIDWNLALNLEGGPTWSRNFLDSAVLVNETSGTYLKNPMFYAIGHLSRFIKAGSHVLESQLDVRLPVAPAANSSSSGWLQVGHLAEQLSDLLAVASELQSSGSSPWRPIGLVLLNRSQKTRRVAFELAGCRSRLFQPNQTDSSQGGASRLIQLELTARSVTSLAFNC